MMVFTSEAFWVPLYVVTALVIGKKYGKNAVLLFIAAGILILCTDQFAGIFKHSVQRLRPSHDPQMSFFTHIFNNYKGGLYSFYSAHSSNAFGYATFTMLIFRNRIYTLFILPWALLVAYTRIYLGLHYPGDILCGAVAGITIAGGVYKLTIWLGEKYFSRGRIQSSYLNNQETTLIVTTDILLILMTLIIVNLLTTRQLVIPNA
jgi:undecaprenyl-diphosphatase